MKQVLAFILMLTLLSPTEAQDKIYKPDWSDLRERPYPQWFRDAKLGIFIHWSLSSVPAWSGKEQYAEWFLRGLMTGDTARINFQKKVFGNDFTYEQYAPLFKGEMFDAAEWAELFSKAGAKYVVFVSKHHDGFCLWPSKYSPGWNSMETGPHRDIVGELTEAIKQKGLKMGLYYSLPEWNNSIYRWGTDSPDKVTRYVDEHMIPQFKELISTYRPSLVFADGEWDHPASTWHSSELISWYYNLISDEAIVNDRWGGGSDGIGFRTPEYSSGMASSERPWAEVRGLGRSFGLNRNESIDAYMSPADLVHFFVKAVAGGGGMILNVGPYCDGQIPLLQQERLLQLGDWLRVNGEAIYGSHSYTCPSEEKDVELKRTDSMINFDWVRNSPGKPILEDDFRATWTGFIQPLYTEEYIFDGKADDGIRAWVDGQLVVDKWPVAADENLNGVVEGTARNLEVKNIQMVANKLYSLKVEYYEAKQNASVSLAWASKSQVWEIIPPGRYFVSTDAGAAHGLNTVYFSKATRLCYTVNHDNLYAISLEWPSDNKLILSVDPLSTNYKVTLLGREGELPWKMENGKMVVDLGRIKISELPCQYAWVFRVSTD
ncbi:MAG: alpha-L-fucosidase [Bacteroidetes bacterium]|nr:alpha-L-fucosidase [Bacteroidota bacterium]